MSRTASRRRPLRVVSPDLPRSRRAAGFTVHYGKYVEERLIVEVFTEAEYRAAHPATRPAAAYVPGVGYVAVGPATEDEFREVEDARALACGEP